MIVLFSKVMQMDGTGLLSLNLLSILDMIEFGESMFTNIFKNLDTDPFRSSI